MSATSRPLRSVLYVPASNERALQKLRDLPTDAVIFDLEDAVAPAAKADARGTLVSTLAWGFGARTTMVRINGFDTEWADDDLHAIAPAAPEAILLPKVNGPEDIKKLSARLDARPETRETAIWAMMETCEGILNAAAVARAPRMAGFVIGTNDLARELGCATGGDRMEMMMALQTCLMAARAAGIACVDGVYNAFRDEEGLRAECEQGRALGMDGKTLIHPAQVAVANGIFAPSPEALDLARRQIEAHDAAIAAGQGVAVLDGRIVENLHIVTAKATLAKAEAIATLENS
ncbi:HpcH/HpaI aldolase/citrate lyase family protein [Oceaniglobus trochenteri]|uniref:HpcH/HpaI aldolase/citrate lyase family protein n=1 Tax=Oceaniglobus trochenteri TaxID=2763260 RepID=UPI001CFFD96C|nr:CoA ester lyase [Oceaniglobus trochenteri]